MRTPAQDPASAELSVFPEIFLALGGESLANMGEFSVALLARRTLFCPCWTQSRLCVFPYVSRPHALIHAVPVMCMVTRVGGVPG